MSYSSIASKINSALSSLDSKLNEIKGISFDSVWSGSAANTQITNLDKAVSQIQTQRNSLSSFAQMLEKLQQYKDNCESISNLRSRYASIPATEENEGTRSSLKSQIHSLETTNSGLKTSINQSLGAISSVSTEMEVISYEAESSYKEYVADIQELFTLNANGQLKQLKAGDSLYNYIPQEQVEGTLSDIKSQYSGRNAAVNCAVGLMQMAASVGVKLGYNYEVNTKSTHYSTYNPEAFPLSDVVNGTDCSSFVSWAVNQGAYGTFTTHSTKDFKSAGTKTSFANAKPGDVLAFSGSHTALIVENHPDQGYFLVAEEGGKDRGLVIQKRYYNNIDATARDMSSVYGEGVSI